MTGPSSSATAAFLHGHKDDDVMFSCFPRAVSVYDPVMLARRRASQVVMSEKKRKEQEEKQRRVKFR